MARSRILPGYISTAELAQRLNCTPDTAREHVLGAPENGLEVIVLGNTNHIHPASVATFLDKKRRRSRNTAASPNVVAA